MFITNSNMETIKKVFLFILLALIVGCIIHTCTNMYEGKRSNAPTFNKVNKVIVWQCSDTTKFCDSGCTKCFSVLLNDPLQDVSNFPCHNCHHSFDQHLSRMGWALEYTKSYNY